MAERKQREISKGELRLTRWLSIVTIVAVLGPMIGNRIWPPSPPPGPLVWYTDIAAVYTSLAGCVESHRKDIAIINASAVPLDQDASIRIRANWVKMNLLCEKAREIDKDHGRTKLATLAVAALCVDEPRVLLDDAARATKLSDLDRRSALARDILLWIGDQVIHEGEAHHPMMREDSRIEGMYRRLSREGSEDEPSYREIELALTFFEERVAGQEESAVVP
jgi:hypothetical protein